MPGEAWSRDQYKNDEENTSKDNFANYLCIQRTRNSIDCVRKFPRICEAERRGWRFRHVDDEGSNLRNFQRAPYMARMRSSQAMSWFVEKSRSRMCGSPLMYLRGWYTRSSSNARQVLPLTKLTHPPIHIFLYTFLHFHEKRHISQDVSGCGGNVFSHSWKTSEIHSPQWKNGKTGAFSPFTRSENTASKDNDKMRVCTKKGWSRVFRFLLFFDTFIHSHIAIWRGILCQGKICEGHKRMPEREGNVGKLLSRINFYMFGKCTNNESEREYERNSRMKAIISANRWIWKGLATNVFRWKFLWGSGATIY